MQYKCVSSVNEIKRYLDGAKIIAFDYETAPDELYRTEERAALDPHKAHIVGVSFSVAEGSAIYIPLAHKIGQNISNGGAFGESLWVWLRTAFFTNPNITKIAHNLAFESAFSYQRGIVIQPPVYDTIAAAQMTLTKNNVFRPLRDSGLKTLVPFFYDVELPSFETVTAGKYFDELDPQDPNTINYTCADSDYAFRLYHRFNSYFDKIIPNHRWIVENIESPTAVYCGLMKFNGLQVDIELMQEMKKKTEGQRTDLRELIKAYTGDIDIGENASTKAFKKFLSDLKLPIFKATAKSQQAADDEVMIRLKEYCEKKKPEIAPLFGLIQEYRKLGKITSTYIDGYLKHVNKATGRIHPDMLPLGTETGRFACRNPNCQNMPRAGNDPTGVRNFFIAPEGRLLLSLDFSQIELRVGAFYCQDEKMLDVYKQGGDIHAQTCAVIYQIPIEQAIDKHAENYKERRSIAKNVNFGTFYGLFPKGLQKTLHFKAGLHVSMDECITIIDNLKKGYPKLSEWQAKTKEAASLVYYTETLTGRRRYLPGLISADWGKRSFAERCALNTPIQGTAADILKLALGRILMGLKDRPWLRPLLQIHDEILFELPKHKLTEAVTFLKKCMEAQPFPDFDVPIIADAAIGHRYGELVELAELAELAELKENINVYTMSKNKGI